MKKITPPAVTLGLLICLFAVLTAETGGASVSENLSVERRLGLEQQKHFADSLRANLSFGRTIPDAQVRQFLQRYSLQPTAIYMSAVGEVGFHRVAPAHASVESIAEARRVSIEMVQKSQEGLRVRARRFLEKHPIEQMDTATRATQRAKALLAAIDRDRGVGRVLNAGEPIIYGVEVLGSEENVRAAMQDPLVVQREIGVAVDGKIRVPSLRIPEPLKPQPLRPESVSGAGREAYLQLQQFTVQNP